MSHTVYCSVAALLLVSYNAHGWVFPLSSRRLTPTIHNQQNPTRAASTSLNVQNNNFPFLESLATIFANNNDKAPAARACKARDLIQNLVQEERCFSTETGALAFGAACASNVVYEDCFEPKPFVGKDVRKRCCGVFTYSQGTKWTPFDDKRNI